MIKDEKRKKRRKRRIYIFLTITFLIAAGVFVVFNVFTVEKVEVDGNELYTDEQIEGMILDDEYSWNSLYVYLKYRFTNIGDVPFVDAMEISLSDPHTVHISVYEKGMLGYLYIDTLGQNAYFDKDGFVIETSLENIEGIPKITGVSCNEVILYEQLPFENSKVLKNLLNLTQTLKKYNLLPNLIHFDSSLEALLDYGNIEVTVGSEENLSQKIIRLSHIMPLLEGRTGVLHLEKWTEENTDIIFDIAEE